MEDHRRQKTPYVLLLLSLLYIRRILAVDFVFNGFNSSDVSIYGNTTIKSNILTLTNHTSYSMGRALYPSKIRSKEGINSSVVLPFSTSFIFAMGPFKGVLPGHGLVFLFVPFTGIIKANPAQNLGFLNRTVNGNSDNHILGVEFDVFKNQEFNDIDDNHVGIDVNSLISMASHAAGYFKDNDEKAFNKLKLNNGKNYQVWIDFKDSQINVTMAIAGQTRPSKPLISTPLNLSDVLEDEMYVGFTAATGRLVESHHILAWSFSNSNFSLHKELITTGLPSFVLPKDPIYKSKGFIAGMTVGMFFFLVLASSLTLFLINRSRRKAREKAEMEEWELEYWPHRIPYHEIHSATKGFSEKNVIGAGGNGKVYRGVLRGGVEVAVKRISSDENNEGMREFLAEITSLGRLKHRNLVGLRGWCKKEKGSLILVYDYMENGSLDKKIFENRETFLGYDERVRILKDVASGVLYLHEGWEAKVLHRDIKSSNVLLDREMNGRLGDFGLARMHAHGQVANTTRVVGTIGYLAPEVIRSGRASTQTDVFGFGVLILEVLSGRRPIEDGNVSLVNWVWDTMESGEGWKAIDERIRVREEGKLVEAERIIGLGLMCAHPEEGERPTMRQVVKVLEQGMGKYQNGEEDGEIVDMDMDMEMYLVGTKSKTPFMFKTGKGESSGSDSCHPTFEEMKQSISTSMVSLTWSDALVLPSKIAGINGNHETEETHKVKEREQCNDDAVGGDDEDDDKVFWEKKHDLLRSTLFRTSPIESRIRDATHEALKELQVSLNFCCCRRPASDVCRNCLMREVCSRLRDAGFNCAVSKSKWRRSSDLQLQAGEHTFLDIVTEDANPNTGGIGEVIVIELNFRGEFEMAKGGEEYNQLIQQLPEVFVGKIHRLEGSIKILCSAAKKCMKDKKMHLGPWRKKEYMKAKWLATGERTTPAPASVTPLSDRTNTARRPRASMLTVDLLKHLPKCNIE